MLIGWQFALAEFVGGAIMIVLLHARLRPARACSAAETRRRRASGSATAVTRTTRSGARPWRERLTSQAGWADAASYTFADVKMLRKEIVIGYVVAGFLAVLVPMQRLERRVHQRARLLDERSRTSIVGPFIAIISFVCSIGNVPLAAALWHGGISFGGVISFIFADLIALPLLLIYRSYYGGRLTLKLLALFWTVMSAAGLAVEYLFRGAAAIVPTERPAIDRADRASRGTTRRSSTSSSSPCSPASGGWRGTSSGSAAAPATRSTPSAGCRSRSRTPRRALERDGAGRLLLLRPLPPPLRGVPEQSR